MANQEKPWLVKSSQKIMGPYSTDEVYELLRKNEVVVLDEIAQPLERWSYIRDRKQFEQIVEELRIQHLRSDDATSTASLETITGSLTEPIEVRADADEITDDVDVSSERLREIVYDSVPEVTTAQSNTGKPANYQFGQGSDQVVKANADQATRRLWTLTVVILLAVFAVVAYKKIVMGPENTQQNLDTLKQDGIAAAQLGDYRTALEKLKLANEQLPNDYEIFKYLSPLLIQYEGRTTEGRRMAMLARQVQSNDQYMVWTSLGLADIYDEQYDDAIVNFKNALRLDQNYQPAQINLGSTHLLLNQWQKGIQIYKALLEQSEVENVVPLLLADALIRYSKYSQSPELLDQAESYLVDLPARGPSYNQEALFLRGLIDVLRGETEAATSKVEILLDMDPEQTADFQKAIFVYREPVNWRSFENHCEEMAGSLGRHAIAKALLSFCFLKTGNAFQAKRFIEDADQMDPRNPLIKALYGTVFMRLKDDTRAFAELQRAADLNRGKSLVLPHLQLARLSNQMGDWPVAKRQWREVRSLKPGSMAGLVGMGEVYFEQGQSGKVRDILNKAEAIDPSTEYIPLVRLTRKFQRGLH